MCVLSIVIQIFKNVSGDSRMAQQMEELATKPGNLSFIPGSHKVRENWLPHIVL